MGWVVRLVVLLGVSAAVSGAALAWGDVSPAAYPRNALTENLPRLTGDISPAFDRRVRARFPVGASEADMGAELSRNGFARRDWTSRLDQDHFASRSQPGFPCRIDFTVIWRADGQGKLVAIRGETFTACL